ncbi:MAG: cobalt ECF transporter T component CbiQ [Proteobacteria bacterium]|nr:cobalt ECF transporter T component CbiQ [Pseudomonadota bacterium]MBU1585891.1 cobalt ECF transporter T component CbiQ [Pseudomonadota bacterium]MBU2453726.1 cobalt ECF transporter T component CbiQ [Pseudomonadota bacterium]MBU2627952.1 cobalt ECF transporter T component CbiQ [Pseudomonadota bacterium]
MIEEKFADSQSVIHQIDPKIRIIASIVLSFATALCDNLYLAVIYFCISSVLIILAKLNPKDVAKRLKPLFWFLFMIWLILPITFDGEALLQYYGLTITGPGVLLCAKITIKSISILLIFTALITTMTIASLGNGLHRICVPDKMVFLLLMTYRYISVIEEEYTRLLRAAKFRGFNPGTNVHSYKTFAYLAGMLFVRASLRAQRVHQAMLCRGFNQKFHTLDVYPPNRLNSIFLTGVFAASLSLVILEIIWV